MEIYNTMSYAVKIVATGVAAKYSVMHLGRVDSNGIVPSGIEKS
jgi:hypothetical protein|tara:strand:- start:365 stop:496 length:132 start_codon:yes stop_codon:yes gene_type:complete